MVVLVTGAMIAVGEWMHLVYKLEEQADVFVPAIPRLSES
jgi:hypothetical protein